MRFQEVTQRYRRRKKRTSELPRAVSLLLAWEGAIVAGVFLGAIGLVAAGTYMMERFDERTRRTSLIHYYQQRLALSAETLADLQESYRFYSSHAQCVGRHLAASSRAADDCRQRLAGRRRDIEAQLAALGALEPPPATPPPLNQQHLQGHGQEQCGGGGGGGGGGGWAAGAGGLARRWLLGPVVWAADVAVAPWRQLYVATRLEGWRRELQALEAEAVHAEQWAAADSAMCGRAADKLSRLSAALRREAATHEVLRVRLQRWRQYSCRGEPLIAASGEVWGWGNSSSSSSGSGGSSSRWGVGSWPSGWGWGAAVDSPGQQPPPQAEAQSSVSGSSSCGSSSGSSSSSSSSALPGVALAEPQPAPAPEAAPAAARATKWMWSVEVYRPSWMDEDEVCGVDMEQLTAAVEAAHAAAARERAQAEAEARQLDEDGEEEGGGGGGVGDEAGAGGGEVLAQLLAELRPLLDSLQGGGSGSSGGSGAGGGAGGFPRGW